MTNSPDIVSALASDAAVDGTPIHKCAASLARLRLDLQRAVELAAEAAAAGDDGGASNFDSVRLYCCDLLPRPTNQVEAQIRAAGLAPSWQRLGRFRAGYTLSHLLPPSFQGAGRTRAVRAAQQYLSSRGWPAVVDYQID